MMIALTMMLLTAATGKAMSYEQARNEALFLTDKMAYELNLTDEQYEAAYEINLDYLMGVTSRDDVYGIYWERRNLDLSYILLDWQWEAFQAASYFFRPLYWLDGFWHFAVYARYPHRDYFFFGRPVFYASYRGGHAWHVVGGHGYYHGHRDHYRPAHNTGHSHFGMLDRWNRGDYNHGRRLSNNQHGSVSHHGGPRSSSTQSTVNRPSHSNPSNHSTMNENRPNRPTTGGNHTNHSSASSGGAFSRSNSSGTIGRSENRVQSNGSFSRSESRAQSSGSFSRSESRAQSSGSFSRGGGNIQSSGSFSRGGGSSHSGGSLSGGGGSSHSSGSAGRSSGGVHHSGGRR